MIWLRSLFFLSPLVIGCGALWIFDQVGEFRLADQSDALVYAIDEPIGTLNPVVPLTGVTGEIADLLFVPLLSRDDDLRLRPNLLNSWNAQTIVSIRCSSEEAAGESEAKIRSGEYLDDEMTLIGVDRVDRVLSVILDGHEVGLAEKLVSRFETENLGEYLLVKLSLLHSIEDSFETFLRASVEKTQIRMIEYEGDEAVNLFLQGETDLFLRELELYYESNRSLDPLIELIGEQAYTSSQEMVFTMRSDVRWHDGRALTTDDLIFSYNTLTGPSSPLPLADSFWFVEQLIKVDDYKLKVLCGDTPAMMMESWEKLTILPSHLLEGDVEPVAWMNFFQEPVGNGPYRYSKRLPEGGIELVASENFFDGSPLQKKIVYRKFGSLESILLALRSQRIDAIVPGERFGDWAERNPGLIRSMKGNAQFQHFIAWNLDRAPLDQFTLRQALAEAVDLSEILRDTRTEFQTPTTSLFYPGIPYCDDRMSVPEFAPKAAEEKFAEAGYRFDEKTETLVDEKGDPFAFTLTTNEENPEYLRLAEAIAEQWSGYGIAVKVEALPWNELLTRRLLSRKFDAVLLGWELPYERDRFATWHSSSIGPGGGNFFALRNQIVDEILEQLRYETEPDEARRLTARLQESISELQPCFFLCDSGRIVSVRKDAIEVVRGGAGDSVPLGIGKAGLERSRPWWVRQELKKVPVMGMPAMTP